MQSDDVHKGGLVQRHDRELRVVRFFSIVLAVVLVVVAALAIFANMYTPAAITLPIAFALIGLMARSLYVARKYGSHARW